MAVETSIVNSPGWWLSRLIRRLVNEQRPKVERLARYYRGEHPLPRVDDETISSESFANFLETARSNYLALVVEAVVERMKVKGFRTGATDKAGDDAAMREWQRAHLDADQVIVYRAMAATSLAYVIVGEHPRKSKPGKRVPLVTIEDPSNVITEAYPDDRREQAAGLKMWTDSFGFARATLYLPDRIVKYRAPRPGAPDRIDGLYTEDALRLWVVVEEVRNPLGVVPVVPFTNRVGVDGNCVGEFEDVIDIQNRINATLLHRLVAEKYGAFRQKAILNLAFDEEEEVDENGNKTGEMVPVVPELPSHPGLTWLLQGEHLNLWESSQTSTADILKGVEADIRDLAAITRTPPHYLLNGIINASGDALSAAETGLVAKVRERIGQAGESWEIVMRLVFTVLGDTERANEESPFEVLWSDPMYRSLSEVSDAVVKQSTAGVPWRSRMETLGYSPAEIDRMEIERTQDAMMTALAAPAPAPVPGTTPQEAPQGPQEPPAAGGGTE